MFHLLQSASDDQTAIGACVLILSLSALFVFASFHLGPAGQKLRNRRRIESDALASPQKTYESSHPHERAA